ncbi:hypothetical protein ACTXG6_43105 [Pseudonocardia sp. Cha107L01]|uniref:hypothetical protein n=1 Tax=Pseudonocardia sp. Cha107L01 TaxID=3457576 RepID=UPI00403E544E
MPDGKGALLIDQYGPSAATWETKKAGITERQKSIGRKFDGIQIQYWGGGSWDGVYGMEDPTKFQPRQEQWAKDDGAKFVAVSWNPDFTIDQVNSGAADAIWTKAANYWKSFSPMPVMLRTFIEFNVPAAKFSALPDAANGDVNSCGTQFQSAWQRMVSVFRYNAATNVGFWYNPYEGVTQCVANSYPGDHYVDWVGSDAYSGCSVGDTSCWVSPLHSGWSRFDELFNYEGMCAGGPCLPTVHDTFGPRKPFVIGETGTSYDASHPISKSNYFHSVVAGAKSMNYLRGISFFDEDTSAVEPTNNWMVDAPRSDPRVYSSFKELARDPWFNVGARTTQ